MKKLFYSPFALFTSCLALTACQASAPANVNQAPKPTIQANVTTSPNAANKSVIKTFDGKGVVTKINLELGSVALDHEEIKDLMPAMEGMEFYVSDKKLLKNLNVGDRVKFVLEDNAGAERIINIEKN